MANELKCNLSLSFNKNGAKVSRSESFSVDVTGNAYHSGVQVITNANEDIMDNSDIGAIGYYYIKLLSAPTSTTYITYGYTDDAAYAGKLEVGESALVKAINAETNLWVKASAAENVEVEYCIIEV
tara:strand:+ start:37 stop:414 length:378 start_codon:yes stop_codon:yes gene_type:complete